MATRAIPVISLPPAQRRLAVALSLGDAAVRGADIAVGLGITLRTLYRDIEKLRATGVPVEGEPGIGYRLPAGAASISLTRDERRALIAGAKLVKAGGDAVLAAAAASLMKKAQGARG